MTAGVGGSTIAAELAAMAARRTGVEPIATEERRGRIAKAQRVMQEQPSPAIDDPFAAG